MNLGRENQTIPWLGIGFVWPLAAGAACLNRPRLKDLMTMLTAVIRDDYWVWCAVAERERESHSCSEKGRDIVVAVSLCKLQRKEEHTIHSKSDINICSPTKPKPTEYRIHSAEAACCVFPATSNVFCHLLQCHLNLIEVYGRRTAQT